MGLYELQVFAPPATRRGKKWVRVKSMTLLSQEPHEVATRVWQYTHCTPPYRCVVLDRGAGKGGLCPVVSYEELVRRAGSTLAPSGTP
jgi:hypothetical protein